MKSINSLEGQQLIGSNYCLIDVSGSIICGPSIFSQEFVTLEIESEDEVRANWTNEYNCDNLRTDNNGVLYLELPDCYKAVGIIVNRYEGNSLAKTYGNSLLGNVHGRGWRHYENYYDYKKDCNSR